MSHAWFRVACAILFPLQHHVHAEHIASGPVLVAGATGRTGALVYNSLKGKGIAVRGLVRNASKAREYLGCKRCDESEGIFIGDVTQPLTLWSPTQGASSLVIASSATPICRPFPNCTFPAGAFPVDVDWIGAKSLLGAFANATASRGLGHVVLISTMGTTSPEDASDSSSHIFFYKLNFEATLMASGLPFTIVKPCGLNNDPPTTKELVVGHDDALQVRPPMIARADVARVIVASLQGPELAAGLRFDLCSKAGTPTTDSGLARVLSAARYPWQSAGSRTADTGMTTGPSVVV